MANNPANQLGVYPIVYNWLVVSTLLKNISQIGNLPQTGVKIKNIWNHQFDKVLYILSIDAFHPPNHMATLKWRASTKTPGMQQMKA